MRLQPHGAYTRPLAPARFADGSNNYVGRRLLRGCVGPLAGCIHPFLSARLSGTDAERAEINARSG
jgi:hypothetical protein